MEINPNTLYIDRAIIDFVMLTKYRSYNDKTLRYINVVLIRINLLKEIFRIYRFIDSTTGKNYFNFLKFYSISYLSKIIQLLDLLDEHII